MTMMEKAGFRIAFCSKFENKVAIYDIAGGASKKQTEFIGPVLKSSSKTIIGYFH